MNQQLTSQGPDKLRALKKCFCKKAGFWLTFVIFFISLLAPAQAERVKDSDLEAFYYQVFGEEKLHPQAKPRSKVSKQKPKRIKQKKRLAPRSKLKPITVESQAIVIEEKEFKIDQPEEVGYFDSPSTPATFQAPSVKAAEEKEFKIDQPEEVGYFDSPSVSTASQITSVPALINQQITEIGIQDDEETEDGSSLTKKEVSTGEPLAGKKPLTEKRVLTEKEPQAADAANLAALFAKAFGKKPAATVPDKLKVELKINQTEQGDVTVYSSNNKINQVNTKELLGLLEDSLKGHVLDRLKKEISEKEKISFKKLKKFGIDTSYNSLDLSLDLQIKPELRKPQILNIGKPNYSRNDEKRVAASEIASYFNLYSNLGLPSEGSADLKMKLESSINIKDVVFENNATYINDKWKAGTTTLTYDEPDKLKRYVIGDIATGNRNFQENLRLQGVRVSKEFFMDPDLQLQPKANESFILETQSEVEVFINNRLQQRFYLKKGIYSLEDIGLYNGANNIRIRIKDEFGKITEKSSTQFYDSHLLKPDLSVYAFSVGLLSKEEAYVNEDLKNKPIVSAYYQRGISETVTMSLDLQASPDSYLLGSEIIASIPFGSIKSSFAISEGSSQKTGFATRFEFRPNIKRELIGLDTLSEDMLELDTSIGKFLTGWSVSGELRNEDFQMVNEVIIPDQDNNKLRANLQTQFGLNLPNNWQGSFSLSLSDYYDADTNLTARLSASKRFNNGVRWSVGAQYDSKDEYSVNVGISIPLSREKHRRRKSLDLLANTKTNSVSSKLSFQPLSQVGKGSLSGSLEHQQNNTTRQQKFDLNYRDTYFEASLDARNNSRSNNQQLNVGLNTSLACIGSDCGISRPINDSFALISGPSNQKEPVAINTGNNAFKYSDSNDTNLPDNYTAVIPRKGIYAVLPLESYHYQRVNIDDTTLPTGFDTEKTEFELFPRYHQGFKIKAGGEPSVIVDGTLLDKNQKPLGYKGGQWISLVEKGKTIAFFSNKIGRFRLPSIPAGKYKLELFDYPDMQQIQITVPDRKGEVHDVGSLVVIN